MKKNSIFFTSGAPLSSNLQNQTKLLSAYTPNLDRLHTIVKNFILEWLGW